MKKKKKKKKNEPLKGSAQEVGDGEVPELPKVRVKKQLIFGEEKKRRGRPGDALRQWQFKPGQSGNPKGRTRGQKSLSRLLRGVLEQTAQSTSSTYRDLAKRYKMDPKTATVSDVLMVNFAHQALTDRPAFVQELLNRIEGKIADRIIHGEEEDVLEQLGDEEIQAIIDADGMQGRKIQGRKGPRVKK